MRSSRFAESLRAARRVIGAGNLSRRWFFTVALTFAFSAVVGTVPPLLTGRIIDALGQRQVTSALRDVALYVLLSLLLGVVAFFGNYASTAFREGLAANLRVALMAKLHRAQFGALTSLTLGEVGNRITGDIDRLCVQFEYALLPGIQGACALAGVAVAMLYLDLRLALVSFFFVLLIVIPLRLATPRIARIDRDEAESRDDFYETINETSSLSAFSLLRNVRAAAREQARLREIVDRMLKIRLHATIVDGIAGVCAHFITIAGPAAILSLGAYLLMHGQITVGLIVTFLMYQGRMYEPFGSLANLPTQVAQIGVLAVRLLDILDLQEERGGNTPFECGAISLQNVNLQRADRAILKGASLEIEQGAHIALIGPSGAGKSTLATLLMRLYDADTGAVKIGSHAIGEFELGSLRNAVALVAQDPLIFDAPVLANLTYTNPVASPDDVFAAIEMCRLAEVIARLPDGVQTRLGQRGFRLSGGERQRMCLARAIVQAPDILILDEALTGVDLEMEVAIMNDLRRAMAGKTLIVITHRLGTIGGFDCIACVEAGAVSVQGSHALVRERCAWYREFCAGEPNRALTGLAS